MKTKITQKELCRILKLRSPELSQILSGERGISPKRALELEKRSGVGRFIWLYGTPADIRRALEQAMGRKINFGRGRLPKKEEKE